ncbi:DUF2251 domain-containing protein [Hymenobacter sp. BT491]|uniref:DUF2251 domain-containing protein n=1 Tax=Hymenobacter sp. BT491 TaxID=2766779 RepID=UPI001653A4ED|nr:DUF2251 domain-containing protein [Hymenobacter sp. BT491]MBC6991335.1 DUF2251 domain-containing protein [Hymenobacter sp. BT491]
MKLAAEEQFLVGAKEVFISSFPGNRDLGVIFEDDGTTGYFYAVNQGGESMIVVDALHIYNVDDVADKEIAVTGQIFWDEEESAAAMIINGYCHALFDFKRQAGFCRNAYPPSMTQQTEPRELTDDVIQQYFAA